MSSLYVKPLITARVSGLRWSGLYGGTRTPPEEAKGKTGTKRKIVENIRNLGKDNIQVTLCKAERPGIDSMTKQ